MDERFAVRGGMCQLAVLEGVIVAVLIFLGPNIDQRQSGSGHLRNRVLGHVERVLVVVTRDDPAGNILDDHGNPLLRGSREPQHERGVEEDLLILATVFINRILCGQWFVYK